MPDELTEALRGHAVNLPSVTPSSQPASRGGASPRPRPPKTVQINWNASEQLARTIAFEAVGSTRRFIARLMKQADYDVPEADLNPADNRRRWT
jgi:hypothetical protein